MITRMKYVVAAVAWIATACGGAPAGNGTDGTSNPNPDVTATPDTTMPPQPANVKAEIVPDYTGAKITFSSPPLVKGWNVNRLVHGSLDGTEWTDTTEYVDLSIPPGTDLSALAYQIVPLDNKGNPVMEQASPKVNVALPPEPGTTPDATPGATDNPGTTPTPTEHVYAQAGDEQMVLDMLTSVNNWIVRPVDPSSGLSTYYVSLYSPSANDNSCRMTLTSQSEVSCNMGIMLEPRPNGILETRGLGDGCVGFGATFATFINFDCRSKRFDAYGLSRERENPPYEVVPANQ